MDFNRFPALWNVKLFGGPVIAPFSGQMSDNTNRPDTADNVGQAAGGITGVLAGAVIGSTAGPIGTLLGGIAGAIGGWWSGRAIAEAAEDITESDEAYYRADFARAHEAEEPDLHAKSAYYLGDVAAANPAYTSFDDVDRELSRAWSEAAAGNVKWQELREYASVGFQRGKERRQRSREHDPTGGADRRKG
jgi:hypothetical protein